MAFPVSPNRFEAELNQVPGGDAGYIDHRITGIVARFFELELERMAMEVGSDLERLALYRAALTVLIEAVGRADDSLGELADVYREAERRYLGLLAGFEEAEDGLVVLVILLAAVG
jgi:hypothetical protein